MKYGLLNILGCCWNAVNTVEQDDGEPVLEVPRCVDRYLVPDEVVSVSLEWRFFHTSVWRYS